ncbi:MAG: YggS family pyridoxal phosphate-dependent enzyme [Bryobacterales bacterium]|nr:YggS family pyridoxal phosphate-dependent enzyme [Bryobacterales bacterium]
MESSRSTVSVRLNSVRERIAAAARRAGRDPDEITLVAVSKRKPPEDIVAAYEAGQRDFGENYVQEFERKSARLPPLPGARFHLIGKLQSNKAKRAAGLFSTIHTLDSVKLARRLDRFASALEVFLELKLSPEESKAGMDPASLEAVLGAAQAAQRLEVAGLMAMPPWNPDPEQARPYFRRLRVLAEAHGIGGLSMGMSHDLEVAIEEGATHVRVGTAIFGKRPPRAAA